MASDKKAELLEFLERRAFNPVLHAKSGDKDTLEHVQRATRDEIERYRNYGSAEEVVINFKRDLHSSAAKKVHAELRRLHLPTIEDVRDEFEAKARELGVDASES